jgi:CRISPR-associated protein Cas5h
MRILVFDLKGKIAHFRRPDTTTTHASYPFITRTVLHGLLASVLGEERLVGENLIGIQILSRIKTVTQELSFLGKGWVGGGKNFNRPTSIELVVNPHYRIYYTGEHLERLSSMIQNRQSTYHTYLGSAYCLTFPEYIDCIEARTIKPAEPEQMETLTVVPSHAIEKLSLMPGVQYGRVGGMQYEYLGDRTFRGTINIIYESEGKILSFIPKIVQADDVSYRFCELSTGEAICLW